MDTRRWIATEAALDLPETKAVAALRASLGFGEAERVAASAQARRWIERVRRSGRAGLTEELLAAFPLSSEAGLRLMRLAEALPRIPDEATAEALLAETFGALDGVEAARPGALARLGQWGLSLAGRFSRTPGLARRLTRQAASLALEQLSRQFVFGETLEEALARIRRIPGVSDTHTFDCLGEAALSTADAERYAQAYRSAIEALAARGAAGDSVSIKLSALHPRFEAPGLEAILPALLERLRPLLLRARDAGLDVTLDAEESERLTPTLIVFERLRKDPALAGWEGLGLAVQAYNKRAPAVIAVLAELAMETGARIPVRLVKGAYWDAEIKRAQQLGLPEYPVYTRKAHTDLAYLACARQLLSQPEAFRPQFATHNAHTLAALRVLAAGQGFECQRLHGMGEALYRVIAADGPPQPCRVYAPIGSRTELLPYLVRRLLENGANGGFVQQLLDPDLPAERLAQDPGQAALAAGDAPALPLPAALFEPRRRNSRGWDLHRLDTLSELASVLSVPEAPEAVGPGASPAAQEGPMIERRAPGALHVVLSKVRETAPEAVAATVTAAHEAWPAWADTPVGTRAAILEAAAEALEAQPTEALRRLVWEAGKTWADAVAELRETVDFLRYYAEQARSLMSAPQSLPGPTGERNTLQLHPRGVWACIAPWNFPLAIFTGQIAAALVTGNAVVAKPAEQTPGIACWVVERLHQAGVPREVLQLVLGDGRVGEALVASPAIAGVAFTGSQAVAKAIQRRLAERPGPILPLIAETGGQNALIADTSALPEALLRDALHSAFGSAGQRCSALRVLCLPEDTAPALERLLVAAAAEWRIGDPARPDTDIGPVIDETALGRLHAHVQRLEALGGRRLFQARLPEGLPPGHYFPPTILAIDALAVLEEEAFGPVLHVLRYRSGELDALVEAINALGYGLTLGIHSRLDATVRRISQRARVGNVYVNRGMTGAVVGSQPFGGEGLSGTGPKAGGPHYLARFCTERTLTVNTAAIGGNLELLALRD